jgi:hypothetical protein
MRIWRELIPALVVFKKPGIRRPGLGGGYSSSSSRYEEPGLLDKVRLSRERCLFEGGAGGVTVSAAGIMASEVPGRAETRKLSTTSSLPGCVPPDGKIDATG